MSLRRRILLVTILAIVALIAAFIAIALVRADTSAAREQDAFERGDTVVNALVKQLERELPIDGSTKLSSPDLRNYVTALIGPLADASAGICDETGAFLLVETVAPTAFSPPPKRPDHFEKPPFDHFPPDGPPGLLPLDRDVVMQACRAPAQTSLTHIRFAAPNDLLFLTIQRIAPKSSVFALIRMPNRGRDRELQRWHLTIGALGLATLLLVLLTLDTLRSLRQGSQSLERALGDLQHNLRSKVPIPRADELAHIARRMQDMAENLAASIDRERDLARRLGQEQRLIALGRVVAGVAHEVRNPLTGMKLTLDTMARRTLDTRSTRDVAICLEEIERLDRVVRSLLLIARRGSLERNEIDLRQIVEERIAMHSALVYEHRVRMECSGAAHLSGSREDFGRMVDNLLRNAIEASPPDSTVEVRLDMTSEVIRLAVIDTGDGVPEQRIGELFEPFFTCKPEGTGLGLVLSRAIVEAHEGQLTYERRQGRTHFIACFPCLVNDEVHHAP